MDRDQATLHRGARLAQQGMRVSVPVVRRLYVGVALLGLLATPLVTLLWAPVVGVAVAGLYVSIVCFADPRWYTRRLVTATGVVGTGFLPFVAGLALLQGFGGFVGVLFLSLLALAVASWVHEFSTDFGTAPRSRAVTDLDVLQEMLHVVPLEVLFSEWRAAQADPTAGSDDRADPGAATQACARIRAMLLDEMERRDATGFKRWLEQGATDPPDGYIRDDQGLAA